MRLSLDLGLGSRWSYDNTALGNGILAWMSRTGVWQDEANGQPTLWNDGEVWDDGVSRNFTASALDTNADPGDLCGTIAPLPDGGAVTYTLADDVWRYVRDLWRYGRDRHLCWLFPAFTR
jgi:hypothetical protein